jgi:hypothetical protein
MVSPVHGDYRRVQAETPLIVLFKFAEPALKPITVTISATFNTIFKLFKKLISDAQ